MNKYIHLLSAQHPSPGFFYLKLHFGNWTLCPSSVLLGWAKSTELLPTAGHQIQSQSQSHITTDSQSASVLVSGAHLGPTTNFSFSLRFSLDTCGFVIL
jgi:hypothetical protein